MNAQPTLGPWNAYRKTFRSNSLGVYGVSGQLLATVDVHQIANRATIDRRTLDARLMASAPKLLAALIKCVAQLELIDGMVHDERSALIEGCEAIAKATGSTT